MGLVPTFKVSGQKAIKRSFRKLGPKVGKKPVRKGARAGAKVLAKEVRRRVPIGRKKQLKKQVKVRTLKAKRGNILIGATTGGKAALNTGDGFYGQFSEYGRRAGGWHRSKLRANPFIVPSFKAKKKKANRVAVDVIVSETNKEVRKL